MERKPGSHNIVTDGTMIPLKHYDLKDYLSIREPTKEDWGICQVVEFTSPEPWQTLEVVRCTRQNKQISQNELKQRSYLGRLNLEMTKHTILATTQSAKSVEAENRVMLRRHVECRLPCLRLSRLQF
jgi:hypothetical protein